MAESRALGADAILVILAMVDDALAADLMAEAARLGMDALVEVHDEAEMDRAGALGADLVGVNNRDLRTFVVDLAVTERLAAAGPAGRAAGHRERHLHRRRRRARWKRAGAAAMLVGESLMRQADVDGGDARLLA